MVVQHFTNFRKSENNRSTDTMVVRWSYELVRPLQRCTTVVRTLVRYFPPRKIRTTDVKFPCMHGFLPIARTILLDATTEATGRTSATIYRATKNFRGRNVLHEHLRALWKGLKGAFTKHFQRRTTRKVVWRFKIVRFFHCCHPKIELSHDLYNVARSPYHQSCE